VLKLIVAFKFVFSFDFSTRTTNYSLNPAAYYLTIDLYRTIESTDKTNILYTLVHALNSYWPLANAMRMWQLTERARQTSVW